MKRGFAKIFRKITEWEWYTDVPTCHLMIHIIVTANHSAKSWRGINIERGQKLTSLESLSRETGLSVQQVRTGIKKLKSTSDLTSETTNNFTLLTVCKYNTYHQEEDDKNSSSNTRDNKRITNEQQTDNKRITTTKNIKNKENIKKKQYGSYSNVLFSDADFEKLKTEFPADYEARIESLSEYVASTGKSYKNHLATIRSWDRKNSKGAGTTKRMQKETQTQGVASSAYDLTGYITE